MKDLEKQVMSNDNMKNEYKKESHIFKWKQSHHLCKLARKYPGEFTSTQMELLENVSQLFDRAADLSQELLGPADTTAFNCNRYQVYLELFLEIAQMINANAVLTISIILVQNEKISK
jgi:hypothetical protein